MVQCLHLVNPSKVSRADGDAKVKKKSAEGAAQARKISVEADFNARIRLAEAEQEEIRLLTAAMRTSGKSSDMWSQWKMTRSAGDALSNAASTIIMTPNMQDLKDILKPPSTKGERQPLLKH